MLQRTSGRSVDPLIFSVDTTREHGSIALTRGELVIEEAVMHAPRGFSGMLYEQIDQLLTRNAVRLEEIDRFATASGPGSFTGVRVGLACVKGLAEALGKPAIAISNLQAIASFGTAPLRAAVLDARRGDIYGAVYDAADCLAAPEVVAKFPEWAGTLPAGEVELVTLDFTPALAGTRFEGVLVTQAPSALAGAIGRLAARARASAPEALDANYVRRADAELFWKE
jgi:tRNA threonylcarbamoyladenosine biosynthesis protein TsaB